MLFKGKKRISVCTLGAPVLSRVAEPVVQIDQETVKLAQEMYEAMVVFNGIGLAAPQYGVSKRMVVIDVPAALFQMIRSAVFRERREAHFSIPVPV